MSPFGISKPNWNFQAARPATFLETGRPGKSRSYLAAVTSRRKLARYGNTCGRYDRDIFGVPVSTQRALFRAWKFHAKSGKWKKSARTVEEKCTLVGKIDGVGYR